MVMVDRNLVMNFMTVYLAEMNKGNGDSWEQGAEVEGSGIDDIKGA